MAILPKITVLLVVFSMLLSLAAAEEVVPPTFSTADPGITPDSPFYFLDEFFEQVGNDPEKALKYKEEKLAELEAMAKKNDAEAAEKALEKAKEYSKVLEKEVTPQMEEEVKKSTETAEEVLEEAREELPQLAEKVAEQLAQEERIALAAEVSTQIKKLCETLAKLDPKQYAETCKIDGDSPQWLQKYDKELTEEQKKHAKLFAEKLTECAESQGVKCDCEGMGVKKFEELCATQRDLKRGCDSGDEDACKAMMEQGPIDMFEYLPDYLHPVVASLMKKYDKASEQRYGEIQVPPSTFPAPCQEAGVTSPLECAKYMKEKYKEFSSSEGFEFKEEEFMQECIKRESEEFCKEKAEMMRRGRYTPEQVEFGPGPCKDKGLTTVEECRRYMDENFQRTAEGAYIVPAGPPARITEFGRDCHAIPELAEKVRCFEEFYNQAQGRVTQPLPPTSASTSALPAGMEDWQRPYYERWLKATSEEEKAKIKMELSQEMDRRNKEQKYKYEYKYEGSSPVPPASVDWVSSFSQQWFAANTPERQEEVLDDFREEAARRGYSILRLETSTTEFRVDYKDAQGVTYTNNYYGNSAAREREEPPEIEVEVRGSVAEVKVIRNGYLKDSFTMRYTSEDQLVSDLAVRLYLSKEEVEANLELEFEESDDEAEGDTEEELPEEDVEEPESEEVDEEDQSGEAREESSGSERNNSGQGMMASGSVI